MYLNKSFYIISLMLLLYSCDSEGVSESGRGGRLLSLRYLYPVGYDDAGLRISGNRFVSVCGLDSVSGFPEGACRFPVYRVGFRRLVIMRKVALGYNHFDGDSLEYRFNAIENRRDTVDFGLGVRANELWLRMEFMDSPWWLRLR